MFQDAIPKAIHKCPELFTGRYQQQMPRDMVGHDTLSMQKARLETLNRLDTTYDVE